MKKSFAANLRKRSAEKGVALLFTLGILGLLTVLALSFAASSMLERKASKYSAGASSARILAQSGLNRAMAVMGFYMQYSDDYDVLVSKDPASSGTYDFIYRLNTDVDGTYYKIKASDYVTSNDQCAQWVYVDNGKTGADKELIGRFVYAVVACGGKLDPSACVDTGINEAAFDFSTGITSGEPRVGAKVQEIPIPGLVSSWNTWLSSTYATNMNFSGTGGQLTDYIRWTAYSTFFSEVLDPASTLDPVIKVKWEWDWFAVDEADQYDEAYWIDLNNDSKRDATTTDSTDERFPRFNLARTDWDSGLGAGVNLGAAVNTLRGKTTSRDPFHMSSTANYIEWLKQGNCTGSGPYPVSYSSTLPQKTFLSSEARASQIAANILDYCDSDMIPTSDAAASPTDWETTAPTYTGNEKTPYINEFFITTEATVTLSAAFDSDGVPAVGTLNDYKATCSVNLSAAAEAIDMYALGLPSATILKIIPLSSITASVKLKVDGVERASGSIDITGLFTDVSHNLTVGTYSKGLWSAANLPLEYTSLNPGSVPSVEVVVEIPSINLVLKYNGANVDYAKLPACASPIKYDDGSTELKVTVAGDSDTKTSVISWSADDPRQNLNTGDWNLVDGTGSTSTSYGFVNNGITIPTTVGTAATNGQDFAGADVTDLSTAYIRNAPMQSPWELGLIHRGAKWETINLKKYNTASGINLTMGEYNDGDANILDQVKMTSNTQTYGLVNLKTSNQEVIQTLFAGIPVNDDYQNVTSSAISTISVANAAQIAGEVKSYIAGNVLKNRSQIVNASGMSDGSVVAQADDATKEAIIGKMAALTRVDKALTFKVIVVSQTLKDAGGPYGTDVGMKKDFNADGDSSDTIGSGDSALVKVGYKDPSAISAEAEYGTIPTISESRNCQKGVYDAGFDEIAGEQKIIATVKYDEATSKWTIINYELVSE